LLEVANPDRLEFFDSKIAFRCILLRTLMIKKATVTTAQPSVTCPIWIGQALIKTLPTLITASAFSKLVIVSDSGAERFGSEACAALSLTKSALLMIQGGEGCKDLEHAEALWRFFSDQKLDRRSCVVAVGGGAISDLVGFAAGTYMRGIPFISVPTTLLGQVDAGIGGKSGVNFAGVKNLIGVIRQPHSIVIDIDALVGLPQRDLRSGFAEIVKHGLIADSEYFTLATSKPYSAWSAAELCELVARSCEIKASIVEQDENEQGIRKTINFGHTVGHAVEALSLESDTPLTHGEAVAIGMHAEGYLAYRVGLLERSQFEALAAGLQRVGLPLTLPKRVDSDSILSRMSHDKKNVGGKIRWSLLKAIGSSVYDQDVPLEVVKEAISLIQPV
jgi:3-dehydroquinate synthase